MNDIKSESSEEFPKFINVSRIMSYEVENVIQNILEDRKSLALIDSKEDTHIDSSNSEVTMEDVMEAIEEYARNDFAYYDTGDLIYQDENGEEY